MVEFQTPGIATIFSNIQLEREYQAKKWGFKTDDGKYVDSETEPLEFLGLIKVNLDKAFAAAYERNENEVSIRMYDIAALCVGCLQQHGRYYDRPIYVENKCRDK